MPTMQSSGTWTPGLSPDEVATLLRLARDTLAALVGRRLPAFDCDAYAVTPALRVPRATFVTLMLGGSLRGCMGTLAPTAELFRSVYRNAIAAGRDDPRFPPLDQAELDGLDLHVSILGPLTPIAHLADFVPGRDGIELQSGADRSVFLPEVALEQGWTREQTAEHLCLKAGLPPGAWHDAAFRVFQSVVLAES